MADDLQRRGLLADLARQHELLGHDELRVIDFVTGRLIALRREHGALDLADEGGLVDRLGAGIQAGNILDSALSLLARQIADEDRQRAELREQARAEMVGGGFELDQQRTRVSTTPEVIALAEQPRERDEDREVDLEFDTSTDQPIGVQLPDYDFEGGAG